MEINEYLYTIFSRYNLSSFNWLIDLVLMSSAMAVFFKYVGYPFYNHICKPIYNIVKKVSDTCDKVIVIEKELKTNGGSSLKDMVICLRKDVDKILKCRCFTDMTIKDNNHECNQP